MSVVAKALRRSAQAVWHFLVGDTPEFLPAALLVVAAAYGLHRFTWVAVVGLPVVVALVLVVSLRYSRARRISR